MLPFCIYVLVFAVGLPEMGSALFCLGLLLFENRGTKITHPTKAVTKEIPTRNFFGAWEDCLVAIPNQRLRPSLLEL
jgi:hypothetical protein